MELIAVTEPESKLCLNIFRHTGRRRKALGETKASTCFIWQHISKSLDENNLICFRMVIRPRKLTMIIYIKELRFFKLQGWSLMQLLVPKITVVVVKSL